MEDIDIIIKNFPTAREMRQTCIEATYQIEQLQAAIRSSATSNICAIEFPTEALCREIIDKILDILSSKGYEVEEIFDMYNNSMYLVISW